MAVNREAKEVPPTGLQVGLTPLPPAVAVAEETRRETKVFLMKRAYMGAAALVGIAAPIYVGNKYRHRASTDTAFHERAVSPSE